ncbi:hypothetical protein [Enterovibrio norvegicus]|uniref:hypothetical protein n=1 Tax=Enterovibrio norvegicus TaxID=188144 RepID=UPI000C84EBC3|nr:hypothetical protein [Enterovibrio norvegicus]PMN69683.1 hypothetical protein BCT27_20330 [Enterovibrio norvegicus]
MKILVIDDKANEKSYPRKELLDILDLREGIKYKMIEPTPDDLEGELTKVSAQEYDLIIVDYLFDKSRSIFNTGTSLYSLIDSYTQNTPIYLISVNGASTNQIGDFELFIKDELIENHAVFKAEIESHTSLKSCDNLENFLELIGCPEEIEEDIEVMIEPKILNKSSDNDVVGQIPEKEIVSSQNLRLFKWLAHSLLRKEGPLVSKVGAATMLGVSTEYFDRISEQFNDSLYTGIFSQSFNSRWWSCLLEDKIYTMEDPQNAEGYLRTLPFKEAASKLLKAQDKKDFSLCAKCEERFPDGLGIVKDQENELLPVHVACSEFNDALPQEPFFRNPRIIEVE